MVGNLDRIMYNKRAMLLSLDQGLELGPKIFNLHTIDTEYLLNIALEGDFSGVIMHPGLAEKYHWQAYRDIPLIVKLNGRSSLGHLDPIARQFCSVEHAMRVGADAVAYSIYDGISAEPEMFAEFGTIVEKAHSYGIPVIAFMYVRNESHSTAKQAAYEARIALELGADFVKVIFDGNEESFDWIVRCAGRCKVLVSDPNSPNTETILKTAHASVSNGGAGIAFGHSIWQHPNPLKLAKALRQIIYHQRTVKEALEFLK